MNSTILVLNGPNLNMLGTRQPEIYGSETLDDIKNSCVKHGKNLDIDIDFYQSNHEGELVDWIQKARESYSGIIINAAAFTHTSIAILDALILSELPIIEVHLSNIHKRESFRYSSYVSKVAQGVICGFGSHGYILAVEAIARLINEQKEKI
ncbi:MAG: type II 3-dehydroquinate dehydratase [Alphaproteobacteria bacterium]|nr:type II 3-dehydroquinate dehydratase [Alphaproteobacteria bacterium]